MKSISCITSTNEIKPLGANIKKLYFFTYLVAQIIFGHGGGGGGVSSILMALPFRVMNRLPQWTGICMSSAVLPPHRPYHRHAELHPSDGRGYYSTLSPGMLQLWLLHWDTKSRKILRQLYSRFDFVNSCLFNSCGCTDFMLFLFSVEHEETLKWISKPWMTGHFYSKQK
jgi:hypothetical protein